MKKLVDFYQEHKELLRTQLEAVAHDLPKVVNTVQAEIDKLSDLDGEYIAQLNQSQTRVALAFLFVLKLSLNNTLTVEQAPHQSLKPEDNSISGNVNDSDNINKFINIAPTSLGAGLAVATSGLALGIGISTVTPITLFTVLGTTVAGLVSDKLSGEHQENHKKSEQQSQSKITLKVDIDRLLLQIEQQFAQIDRDIERYSNYELPPPPPPKAELTDLTDILDFLHSFIGDAHYELSELPKFTQSRYEQAITLLRRNEITVKFYAQNEQLPPDILPEDAFDFEKSISPDTTEYINLRPALIKDGKVIRVGRVVKPSIALSESSIEE